MSRTVLYSEHVELGAKIIDFHGWDMPLEYTSIIKEHMSVRERAGIFDVSHMGDITVKGSDSENYLSSMLPTDVHSMKNGTAVYSAFLNENGYMIDDTIVYKIKDNEYFLVPNAATKDKIYNWMIKNKKSFECEITDHSDEIACIALQGPQTDQILRNMNLKRPDSFNFSYFDIDNKNSLTNTKQGILSSTGYTGEIGVEFIIPVENAVKIWKDLIKDLEKIGGLPCGLGARDSLRMEKGFLLSGTDFNEDRTPYEGSISFIVTNNKEYIGKKELEEKRKKQVDIFRGLKMKGSGIPRSGNSVFDRDKEIFKISSGGYSPVLKKGIALGFVPKNYSTPGTELSIEIRSKKEPVVVTKPKIVP
jgi:aminomethyltransferase